MPASQHQEGNRGGRHPGQRRMVRWGNLKTVVTSRWPGSDRFGRHYQSNINAWRRPEDKMKRPTWKVNIDVGRDIEYLYREGVLMALRHHESTSLISASNLLASALAAASVACSGTNQG